MGIIINFLISGVVVLIAAYLVPGVMVSSFSTALIVAAVMGILNAIVKPLLLIITLPINILTLGLFTFVINVVIIYLVAALVPGFKVNSFFSALLFSFAVSIVSSLIHNLMG